MASPTGRRIFVIDWKKAFVALRSSHCNLNHSKERNYSCVSQILVLSHFLEVCLRKMLRRAL